MFVVTPLTYNYLFLFQQLKPSNIIFPNIDTFAMIDMKSHEWDMPYTVFIIRN